MVLKKPYAFLIKHFKLIHLLLAIPIAYLTWRTGAITSFLRGYVAANYFTNETNIAGTYLNVLMYLAAVVAILISLAIYLLMRQKGKKTKFYAFLTGYNILLIIVFTVCYSILGGIEDASINTQSIRLYSDLAVIFYLPSFFFLIYSLLRGIGFDIKKFNFESDVKDLEITDIDNEEFELVIGKDAYKYKRTLRRFIREFKYYVLENKFIFISLSSLIVLLIVVMVYFHFGVFNRTYRATQKISHNHLIVSVEDSILTNLNSNGITNKAGNYLLAISVKIKNNGIEASSLDNDNFQIEVAKRRIKMTLDKASNFPELGKAYSRDTIIYPDEEGIYVLTYEIPEELVNKQITLKILDTLTYEIGSITPIYKTVQLNYDKAFNPINVKEVEKGKYAVLSDTRLKMSQVQIENSQITKSYEYSYKDCYNNKCQELKNKISASSGKTLLVLKKNITIDQYSTYYYVRKGSRKFAEDFITVKYNFLNQDKITSIKDLTPKENDESWVLEVPEELNGSNNIEVLLTIRNKVFRLKLN